MTVANTIAGFITLTVLVSLNVLTVMFVSASEENNSSMLSGPYSTV